MAIFAAIAAGIQGVTTFLTGLGLSAGVAAAVIQVGASALISAASSAIFGTGGGSIPSADLRQKLRLPTNAPGYRFVYGQGSADGTPIPPSANGDYLYAAYLLNSRESDLPTADLFLDERSVSFTGNPFDLTGAGAAASNEPFVNHVTYWIGRGDQTQPPQAFIDDLPYDATTQPDGWRSTDRLEGMTVIWLKINNGSNDRRNERWPNGRPLLRIEGKWSTVWDPRDAAQSLADPSTWLWSENAATCTLDAITQHVARPYQLEDLHLASWIDGADSSDVIYEGEKKFVISGTLDLSQGEFEQQIMPMFYSAAADPILIGGQIGYNAAIYRTPETTVAYTLGNGFTVVDEKPASEMFNTFNVSFLDRTRGGETTHLKPWAVPGALVADNNVPSAKTLELTFCGDALQAQLVRKIIALKNRRQFQISGGHLPPECFDLVAGSTLTIGFASPYNADNGVYELQTAYPGFNPLGSPDSGAMSLEIPATILEHSAAVYAFDYATEFEAPIVVPYDSTREGVAQPGTVTIVVGSAANGSFGTRARFSFAPVGATGVQGYEVKYGITGEALESSLPIAGDIRDANGNVFGHIVADPGTYTAEFSTVAIGGKSSPTIVTSIAITLAALPIPTDGSATAGPGSDEITVTFKMPNNPEPNGIEIYGSNTNDSAAAARLGDQIHLAPNATASIVEGGLGSSVTRYYFARTIGAGSSASAFTASVTATTNP